jgi:ParB family chromosome partitioning protein
MLNTMTLGQLKQIPIEWLTPGRYQPRKHFAQASLQELADSIVSQGLIEPLVVRAIAKTRYEIIAGERRWRAAMLVGLAELSCIVTSYSNEDAAVVTLIENIQREELNPIEEANGYHQLVEEFHLQQDDVAKLVGKSRSHIANILRLLHLCETVQNYLIAGTLSMGHAKMLVGLSPGQQVALAKEVHDKKWSVRQLEKKVKELKTTFLPRNSQCDRDIERLQITLSEQVGAPVQIIPHETDGGWLQIKFFNNDTLVGLLERMGLRYD